MCSNNSGIKISDKSGKSEMYDINICTENTTKQKLKFKKTLQNNIFLFGQLFENVYCFKVNK